jgi:hypothetical protein
LTCIERFLRLCELILLSARICGWERGVAGGWGGVGGDRRCGRGQFERVAAREESEGGDGGIEEQELEGTDGTGRCAWCTLVSSDGLGWGWGAGIMKWADGDEFDGVWKEGKQHGKGAVEV